MCRAASPAPLPLGTATNRDTAASEHKSITPRPVGHPTDSSVVDRILRAANWGELQRWAETALGPSSFNLGVCYGVLANATASAADLLQLLKTIILAGIYERVQQPSGWWDIMDAPSYLLAKGVQLGVGPQLKQAHDQFDALMRELKYAVTHPGEVFGSIRNQYTAKWKRFEVLSADVSLSSQFAAGKIAGEVLLDIAMLIGVGEAAIRLAAKIPELVKLADGLGGALKVGAPFGDAAGGVREAAAMTDASAARKPASFKGMLRGEEVELPDVGTRTVLYTKRNPVEANALRRVFDSKVRSDFVQYLSTDPQRLAELQRAGFSPIQIQSMREYGKVPSGWNIHHKLPLDDGGTNDFSNLILIENEPYHKTITAAQKSLTGDLLPNQTVAIEFPIPPGFVYPPAKP